ncbi:hypothetical protein SHKM778_06000 [Streptomyces sp. KM77-8]|uniref:Peptidoglycan-binding protein n=1 Tax=Streptomyces haneummycinicus TaxID=3074435 RepID=A0AAT9HA06_9ACTN
MTSAAQGVDVLGEGQAGPRGRPVPPALGQAVWQTILRADGYLGTNHSVAVDCSFGADTLAATRQWQKDHGLVADWVARPKTFTKAGQYLRADDTNIYGEDVINYDSPVLAAPPRRPRRERALKRLGQRRGACRLLQLLLRSAETWSVPLNAGTDHVCSPRQWPEAYGRPDLAR